jgi:hydroxymethylpyrimidine pyrophosphatase-like HAD family hydrolase
VRAQTHDDLVRLPLEDATKRLLHGLLCSSNLAVFAFSRDIIVHDGRGSPYADYLRTWSNQMNRVRDIFEPAAWDALDDTTCLVIIGSHPETELVASSITAACADQVQIAHFPLLRAPMHKKSVILIRRAGVNKGTAVTWLSEHFNVPLDEVIVVGDWVNDVPMFAVAGHSFVMGHAPPEVKSAARYELDATVHTGGAIAEAAARCGLI